MSACKQPPAHLSPPIGFAGGLNVHSYVGNDPIDLTDRLGFAPDTWFECWAKCIERRRFVWPIPLLSALPKSLLPPFKVPYPSQPLTTLPSALELYLPTLFAGGRECGRMVSPIATPLTLLEGGYDWCVIIDCAIKCKKGPCR